MAPVVSGWGDVAETDIEVVMAVVVEVVSVGGRDAGVEVRVPGACVVVEVMVVTVWQRKETEETMKEWKSLHSILVEALWKNR